MGQRHAMQVPEDVGEMPIPPGLLPSVEWQSDVCGTSTKFVLTRYSNRVFAVVTQADNFGTLIHCDRDNPMDHENTTYTVRVLLGRRDNETNEVYARTLCELIQKHSPNAGALLLGIHIKEHSVDTFRAVMREVNE